MMSLVVSYSPLSRSLSKRRSGPGKSRQPIIDFITAFWCQRSHFGPLRAFQLRLRAEGPGTTFYIGELDRHLQLDSIVGCVHQILFRSEVTFGRLNRRMPEQQLDLFQFSAGRPAQFRSRAA